MKPLQCHLEMIPDSCFQLKQIVDQRGDSELFSSVNAVAVFAFMANSFGISAAILGFDPDQNSDAIGRLIAMGESS
jgi:hypothetical protein